MKTYKELMEGFKTGRAFDSATGPSKEEIKIAAKEFKDKLKKRGSNREFLGFTAIAIATEFNSFDPKVNASIAKKILTILKKDFDIKDQKLGSLRKITINDK